jgi:hypothetical protein
MAEARPTAARRRPDATADGSTRTTGQHASTRTHASPTHASPSDPPASRPVGLGFDPPTRLGYSRVGGRPEVQAPRPNFSENHIKY